MKKSTKIITACIVVGAVVVLAGLFLGAVFVWRLSIPYSDDVMDSLRGGSNVTLSEVTERLGSPRRADSAKWDFVYTDETTIPLIRQYLYVKTSPDGLRIIDAKVIVER